MKNNNAINIINFHIRSSAEIDSILEQVKEIDNEHILVHIVSFLHNTVLVQSLKKEIQKILPQAQVVLLKHQDKSQTHVTIFTTDKELDAAHLSDECLNTIFHENIIKEKNLNEYRNQLFSRYFTDHLTNLPNLYQLRKDLQEDESLGLVLIRIDNFATINSFYGFVVGDYVIEEVGNHLKEHLDGTQIYRLSGAEFALTLPERQGFYELKEYLSALYLKLKNHVVMYQDARIFIDFTLSSSSASMKSADNIFSKVSMAMKYAQDSKVPFWIYEDRMNFENEYKRNLQLSEIVRDGVEQSRIIPFFQAILDNKTGNVVKYESLARLRDANEKILAPELFIPIAKKIKIYNEITKSIVEKTFSTFEPLEYEFSINLSIEDIMQSEMFNYLLNKLKNSPAAKRVTFELLESEAIKDFNKVERFINEVKRYGAKIAIDDFGSGYSNFSYLLKMQVDYIKIDGELIENIDIDKQSYLIVETIVDFAKKLDIKTVAEYVHSSSVLDTVKNLGIHYSQGFYIDQPSLEIK